MLLEVVPALYRRVPRICPVWCHRQLVSQIGALGGAVKPGCSDRAMHPCFLAFSRTQAQMSYQYSPHILRYSHLRRNIRLSNAKSYTHQSRLDHRRSFAGYCLLSEHKERGTPLREGGGPGLRPSIRSLFSSATATPRI